MNDYERKLFKGRCPYTDEPCEDWECQKCPVEQRERELMKAFDEEETEVWQGYGRTIKAPKGTFDKIFNDEEGEE